MARNDVLAWLTGQSDNIGDSALRRAYAAALGDIGEVTAWAGDPARGYVSGLGLPESSISHTFGSWYRRLAVAACKRGSVFAFNAGEFVVTREYFFGLVAAAPLLLLLKARGGKIIWLGAAIRSTKPGFTAPFIWLARSASMLRWRDTASSEILGVAAPTMPDWAFALTAQGSSKTRDRLAVSLRFDREPPSTEWIRSVPALAERLGLRIVTVAQVERDAPLARRLADLWQCETLGWTSDSHAVQEHAVRELYSRSAAVISDRLHALVIAGTEGAVPLGWTTQNSVKIGRHFDAVGLHGVAQGGERAVTCLDGLDSVELERRRARFARALERSQIALAELRADLRRVASDSPARSAEDHTPETAVPYTRP